MTNLGLHNESPEELEEDQMLDSENCFVGTPCCRPQHYPLKTLHIAPMLDVSNREFRQLFRILSKRCILWTEMVVDETICHTSDLDQHLAYESNTHPIICQIGGISPEYSAKATRLIEKYHYDEINLNMDCPSNRVAGKREFGAVLMKQVETALSLVEAMKKNARHFPVSIKCRIGIDHYDDLDFITELIKRLAPHCSRFVLHARKCLLEGLSPAQNRIVPPLNYPRVYEICKRFPHCDFWINGGIPGLQAAKLIAYGTATADVSGEVHGVPCVVCNASNGSCTAPPAGAAPVNLRGCMLGRAAMDHPSMFWDVDRYFYGEPSNPCRNRRQVLEQYCQYLERIYPRRCCDTNETITTRIPAPHVIPEGEYCHVCRDVYGDESASNEEGPLGMNEATRLKISSRVMDRSLKPILGMFYGLPKSKAFRRSCDELSRNTRVRNCGPGYVLRKAMNTMPAELLDKDFCKTEELTDLPIHVAPTNEVSFWQPRIERLRNAATI